MSEQENTGQSQEEDVEAHRKRGAMANEEAPSDETAEETDDVEAHAARRKYL